MASLKPRTATELGEVQEHIEEIRKMAHSVYSTLGSGYDEIIYKEALMVELRDAHVSYERERYVPILYGKRVIGTGKADIVVIPAEGLSVPIELQENSPQRRRQAATSHLHERHGERLRAWHFDSLSAAGSPQI